MLPCIGKYFVPSYTSNYRGGILCISEKKKKKTLVKVQYDYGDEIMIKNSKILHAESGSGSRQRF